MMIDSKIGAAFKENGYKIVIKDGSIVITRKPPLIGIILLVMIGWMIALAALSYYMPRATFIQLGGDEHKLVVLLILLVGTPFIYKRWMYPRKIVISLETETLFLDKNLKSKPVIPFNAIQQITVTEQVLSSDVSTFKEGNQDFVYDYKIQTADQEVNLINLEFRRSEEKLAKRILEFLREATGSRSSVEP